jgi:N-acetylglutamate synthase/N-acetylornithine aminotransferase
MLVVTGHQERVSSRRPPQASAAHAPGASLRGEPEGASTGRLLADYLAELAGTKPEDLAVSATSIIGPRKAISKLVKNLSLLL